jgi:hypothetical protein
MRDTHDDQVDPGDGGEGAATAERRCSNDAEPGRMAPLYVRAGGPRVAPRSHHSAWKLHDAEVEPSPEQPSTLPLASAQVLGVHQKGVDMGAMRVAGEAVTEDAEAGVADRDTP